MFNKEKILVLTDSEDKRDSYDEFFTAENAIPLCEYKPEDILKNIDDYDANLIILDIEDEKKAASLLGELDLNLSTTRNIPIFAIVNTDLIKSRDAFKNNIKFLNNSEYMPLDVVTEANIVLANQSIFNEM